MATIFNGNSVAARPEGTGASRQRRLTTARMPGTAILLDRLTLRAGGNTQLTEPATGVAWLQGLEGEKAHASAEVLSEPDV